MIFRSNMATTSIGNTNTDTDTTLCQVKLTSDEWNVIEIMEPETEMRILKLIIDGFHDVNYVFNLHMSLISRLKIAITPEIEDHLFHEYFKKRVERILGMMDVGAHAAAATDSGVKKFEIRARSKNTMKKVDLMRIQNMNTTFGGSGDTFDHHIIQTIESIVDDLNRASAFGEKLGNIDIVKESQYLLAQTYHFLNDVENRNEASRAFRELCIIGSSSQ